MSNNGERGHGVKRVIVIHGPSLDLLGRRESARVDFRQKSFIRAVATAISCEFGAYGHHAALGFQSERLRNN